MSRYIVRRTAITARMAFTGLILLLAGSTATAQGPTVHGNVYGGGNLANVGGSVTVNMTAGTVDNDVYGGGALADTNVNNATDYDGSGTEANSFTYSTTVNLTGGKIYGNAYGGGLGQLGDAVTGEHWTQEEIDAAQVGDPAYNKTTNDWKVEPVAASDGAGAVKAMVYGDVNVNLGSSESGSSATAFWITNYRESTIVKSGRVFGCNNLNGSPLGNVTVTAYKTVEGNTAKSQTANKNNENATYHVAAVYGGGNLANYTATGKKTHVVINGCGDTSIQYVYGGGNAAAVPQASVDVNATYEIGYVFGGGNGKDQYTLDGGTSWKTNPGANVNGNATTILLGGVIHEAFGGSNEKGSISGSVSISTLQGDPQSQDYCELDLAKLYGAGKNADIDGDLIVVMGCMPGDEKKTGEVYGGAENANVKGNVELTITSGSFGKVFGGNNQSGAIFGHIKLNIEESGCTPIKIDELYLGGNMAPYSVYGYYQDGTITGTNKPQYVPMSASDNTHTAVNFGDGLSNDHTKAPYADPQLNIISATYIGKVFGGGLGADAIIYGNPTVNINQTYPIEFESYNSETKVTTYKQKSQVLGSIGENGVFGGGNEAPVYGNTTVNIGNETTVDWTVLVLDASKQTVIDANDKPLTQTITGKTFNTVQGANITGDVFGGGNQADVTGNSQVNICAKENATTHEFEKVTPGTTGVTIQGTKPASGFGRGVFGGGNQGNIGGDSFVYFGGGSVNQTVYGGGCEADVLGNTHVTMLDGYVFDGVCGGGLSGSVGTIDTEAENHLIYHAGTEAHTGTCIGKPNKYKANTGKCTTVISGGQVGPVELATEGMRRSTANGGPVAEGWVWGAGRGVVEDPIANPDTHFKTYVYETDVTIKDDAFIVGSIIGGGEFGRVLGNTLVKIEGGQIGVGENQTKENGLKPKTYTDAQWVEAEAAVIEGDASRINTIATAMPACSHFHYGRNTGTEQNPNWVYDTYDPYADEYANNHNNEYLYPGGSTDHASDGKTWIGCVFAGGSGYFPYKTTDVDGKITGYDWVSSAGLVEGNSEVHISGGHILTNVYGGNEYTNVKGKCKVTMSGGTIGVPRTLDQIKENPMIGNLFGAGKGDPRVHFNKETNVGDVEIIVTGGTIFGSVFGGGEDGHVLRDVSLTIGTDEHNGPTIGTWGTSYFEGNVFGGGRGFTGDAYTAGNVAGSVALNIKGGSILGSVFGGGRLGSVGYGLYEKGADGYGEIRDDDKFDDGTDGSTFFENGRGHIDISISGGTIGNNYEYDYIASNVTGAALTTAKANMPFTEHDDKNMLTHTKGGNVFAGGMGRMYQLDGKTPISSVDWWKMGCVKSTKLTISDDAVIKSCVYGGGELGQVVGARTTKNAADEDVSVGTEVIINGGTIGTEIKDGEVTKYTFGSVFGGGYGSLEEKLTHQVGSNPATVSYPKLIAGRVKAGTKVNITDGTVVASVYGGGEMAAVGESTGLGETQTTGYTGDTHVIVSGGTIGKTKDSDHNISYGGAKMGNVYGGGSGHHNTVRSGHIYGNTNVTVSDGTIYHNIYGGGAYGSVGDFKYTTGDDEKVNGIEKLNTSGTGVANVTITGGTIGVDGIENGMVFGSSRGDINAPGERDDHTAWVYDTHVIIGTSATGTEGEEGYVAEAGPDIKGSVYGSGENGHVFNDAEVKIHGGTIGIHDGSAADAKRGNVYGGGCGEDKYDSDNNGSLDMYNPLAGIVYGNTKVTMDGGTVLHNIYGAGALGSVGKTNANYAITSGGKTTIDIIGGTVGYDGDDNGNVYGAARGDVNSTQTGISQVQETEVNIKPNTIEGKPEVKGSVFGGGQAGIVRGSVKVEMTGGNVGHDVYGGGALADTQTSNWDATKNSNAGGWANETETSTTYTTTVSLNGGTIGGNAYGGALGRVEVGTPSQDGYVAPVEAYVYGDVKVELNKGKTAENKGCIVNKVFGCNNLKGTPKGHVQVYVYATQNKSASYTTIGSNKTDATMRHSGFESEGSETTYDVAAVYGGGNLSPYEPADAYLENNATNKAKIEAAQTEVYIDGCDLTSIKQVYGGGNAAAAPATYVRVDGAYEIEELFAGGNGKDKYVINGDYYVNPGANVGYTNYTHLDGTGTGLENSPYNCVENNDAKNKGDRQTAANGYMYGSGIAHLEAFGGYVHAAYGGSNEKGNIRYQAWSKYEEGGTCDLHVLETYGGGKNSEIDGEVRLDLGCTTYMPDIFGGAKNADVNSDIVLNITNGRYDRVFGGNNTSGNINGSITVNIKEDGCVPINITNLYLGGYLAGYSIYGYEDDGTVRTKAEYDALTEAAKAAITVRKNPRINVISATSIGNIFGGGYQATVVGDPYVNVNMERGKVEVTKKETTSTDNDPNKFQDNDKYYVWKDANNDSYNQETVTHLTTGEGESAVTKSYVTLPIGTIGNVYGGGNEADIIGDTYVEIGTGKWVTSWNANGEAVYEVISPARNAATITGNVYGGGKGKADTFTCEKAMVGEENSGKGSTHVTIGNGTVGTLDGNNTLVDGTGNVYGGGQIGRVEANTSVTIGIAGDETNELVIRGNVFGAGAGLETHGYSALVRGNSTVTIQGKAKVDGSVYGGGEIATVGKFWVSGVQYPDGVTPPTAPTDLPDGMPYALRGGGTCTVTVQGKAEIAGDVFGAGMGKEPDVFTTYIDNNGVERYYRSDSNNAPANYDINKQMPKRMATYESYNNETKKGFKVDDKNITWIPIGDENNPTYVWEYFDTPEKYHTFLQTLSLVNEPHLTIDGSAKVKESVYGGSKSGFVLGTTTVTTQGSCTIGTTGTTETDGDVFGGGLGLVSFAEAGLVKGNTTVNINGGTIKHNIYGGGRLGSVGTYKISSDMRNFYWTNTPLANIDPETSTTFPYNDTGVCNVTISGGEIGTTGVAMNVEGSFANGNVFGGGKGKDDTFWCEKGIVYKTNVSVTSGTVNGNVYGGGEVGRVETDGIVKIGPDSGTSEPTIKGNVFGGGAGVKTHGYSALVRGNTYVTVQSSANVEHNVYGGGQIAAVGKYYLVDAQYKLDHPETNLEIGMPYSLVSDGLGICYVTVKGGAEITGSVFGGGKGKTPENFDYTAPQSGDDYHGENEGDYDIVDHMPKRMMNDFAGKNTYWEYYNPPTNTIIWEYFDTKEKYYTFLETLGLTTQSKVTIGGTRNNDDTVTSSGSPTINGNVYGGSESGFVQHNTSVTIAGGTIGTTTTGGDVYGGGLGLATFAEAGRVRGNTTVTINAGAVSGEPMIYHNVYGGGQLGDVGTINKTRSDYNYKWTDDPVYMTDAANKTYTWNSTGLCTVNITGGTIGTGVDMSTDGTFANGNVYGAGKGLEDTWWCEKAIAYKTNVTITNGTINGTVYGGGQVGRVEDDATVTIGTENEEGTGSKPNITGNVFGAGAGLKTHGYSALVRGDAYVTVQGIAQVGKSVYGGGEIASVGKFTVVDGLPKHPDSGGTCTVNIKGHAKIGAGGTGHNVFGACKGVTPAYNNIEGNENRSKSMQLYNNRPGDKNPETGVVTNEKPIHTYWDYYVDDDGHENRNFVWVYYQSEADYLDFLETLALTSHPIVTVAEDATVNGSVFGGGERGITLGSVEVNMNGGTVTEDVYGGGALANTNKGNWDDSKYVEVTGLPEGHTLTGLYTRTGSGTTAVYTATLSDETAAANTTYYSRGNWASGKYDGTTHATAYKTDVILTGGTIKGNVYGGGLGQIAREASGTVTKLDAVKAKVYGDVLVTLNRTKTAVTSGEGADATTTYTYASDGTCVVQGDIFGCNNQNGSPQSAVTVHIYRTQRWDGHTGTASDKLNSEEAADHSYHVKGVYGGGNLSAFYPDLKATRDTVQAYVIIDGCKQTSIKQVYGGGNAASTPATNITINATYEIEEVFGGGNGLDDITIHGVTQTNPGANVGYEGYPTSYDIPASSKEERTAKFSYGSGKASVTIYDGLIHRVFGGSNNKGNVRESAVTLLDDMSGCDFQIDEAYGGGKNAPMDAEAKLLMACIPGLKVAYGGAQEADVLGGVTLTITNGTYERVFGGNNVSGTIQGPIVVNVEETGCRPIIIGELYGGGNEAPYSVYGYDGRTPIEPGENVTRKWNDPQVNVKSFTSIGNVYGGGYGQTAVMVGNPTVNINVAEGKYSGQTSDNYFTGFTYDATNKRYSKVIGGNTVYVPAHEKNTIGAIYNVFGGGNAAKVVGNTNVNIGTEAGEEVYTEVAVTTGASVEGYYTHSENSYDEAHGTADAGITYYQKTVKGADIRGNVYGGGNNAGVTGDTNVTIGKSTTP